MLPAGIAAATTLPGLTIVFGALFLHLGIIASLILNQVGLTIGVGNAVLPLLKHKKLQKKKSKELTHQEGSLIMKISTN